MQDDLGFCTAPACRQCGLVPALLVVLSLTATSCKWFAEPGASCDEVGFNEGDRFQLTVLEKLPQSRESDGEACVPLEVGDGFQLIAGRLRYDEYDGCRAPATGEPIPEFMAPFVDRCAGGYTLGLSCQGDPAQIDTSMPGGIKMADADTLVVFWTVGLAECIQSFRVRMELLNGG